jgi:hypothetical protein
MWWTTEGERVLRGAEWAVFRLALSCLWDETEASGEEEEYGTTGVAVFDQLRRSDRLALLAQVARGLHDEDAPCPDVTALTEGTIAAIFAHLRYLLEVEVEAEAAESGGSTSPGEDRAQRTRHLVLAALHEVNPDRDLPLPDSDDVAEWGDQIGFLMDRILDDRDYLAVSLFLDSDPVLGRDLKHRLGIADDYYAAIPPDPAPGELEVARDHLRRICGRPQAWGRTLVGVLEDSYHGLLIGPCDEATARREEEACRLVHAIHVTSEEGIDCTYPEWVRSFREAAHEAAAQPEEPALPGDQQLPETDHPGPSGGVIPLEGDCRIERRDAGWIIAASSASYLAEVERFLWSNDEPLVFETPAEALAAFRQAREHEAGRRRRYREAMNRLGRPVLGCSRYEEEAHSED